MIRKQEKFSKSPQGMIWLCDNCDRIHLCYGNIITTLSVERLEEICAQSWETHHSDQCCEDCGYVHIDMGRATIHMDEADYPQFLLAVRRFFAEPVDDEINNENKQTNQENANINEDQNIMIYDYSTN